MEWKGRIMAEQLTRELIEQTPDVTLEDVVDDDTVFAELAALSLAQYDRCRKDKAKLLNIRAETLDAEVAKRRPREATVEGQGTAVAFEDPRPWADPVQGTDLLDALAKVYAAYLILPAGGADALALWTVHAYAYDAWNITPRLGITSPTPRCGKTRVLEALALTAPRVLLSSNATPAAIFRAIELWKPTLLIDEADTILPGNEELRGILNSGHTRRTAYVLRTVGEDHEPRRFSTWAPLAIAMIGELPGTLADRSIVLRMRRKRRDEKVKKFPLDDQTEPFAELRRQCVRWARDNFEALQSATPVVPERLHDRAQDNWSPLCAIAAVAGHYWPERVKKTIELLTPDAPEDDSIGVRLLTDMQQIFRDKQTDRIFSEDLVTALHEMEERPWPEYGKLRKAITKNQVARLLRLFDIHPKQTRIEEKSSKGYERAACQDAFERYIPPSDPPFQTETPKQTSNGAGVSHFSKRNTEEVVSFEKTQNPASNKACFGVSVVEGGIEGDDRVFPPPYPKHLPPGRFTVGQHVWLYQVNGQPLRMTPVEVLDVRNIDGPELSVQPYPDMAPRWHNAAYAMSVQVAP
jgi:putative DNA primase/helicase